MIAEAFRQRGERMPIAGFGLIGLVGAAVASVVLWDSDARASASSDPTTSRSSSTSSSASSAC